MEDYTIPTIKENELLAEATMATVKDIRIVNTSDDSKVIAKGNFTLPSSQVIGVTNTPIDTQVTYESGLYFINT